jgi:hypothetical protein
VIPAPYAPQARSLIHRLALGAPCAQASDVPQQAQQAFQFPKAPVPQVCYTPKPSAPKKSSTPKARVQKTCSIPKARGPETRLANPVPQASPAPIASPSPLPSPFPNIVYTPSFPIPPSLNFATQSSADATPSRSPMLMMDDPMVVDGATTE